MPYTSRVMPGIVVLALFPVIIFEDKIACFANIVQHYSLVIGATLQLPLLKT